MARNRKPSPGDLERLSAYMDGQLTPKQRSELEVRLSVEPELAQVLHELESVVTAVGSLETVGIPRSFTLTPEMAGARPPVRSYPLLQLATAISALAFVALIGIDLFSMRGLSGQLAAPANEQFFAESAPSMSDEIQQGEGAALFAAGEQAAEAPLEEATSAAAAMLEEGALAEPGSEIAEDAMKLSATPLPAAGAEERAAAPEPETLEQPAIELGADQQEPEAETLEQTDSELDAAAPEMESELPEPASTGTGFRTSESASPGLEPLRIGQILSGTLALLLGLMLLLRRRRLA